MPPAPVADLRNGVVTCRNVHDGLAVLAVLVRSYRNIEFSAVSNGITVLVGLLHTVHEDLARESSFPAGCEVLHICRVRSVDGVPLIRDINYFLKSAVPGLTEEIAGKSIYAYLEQELKMQIVTSKRKITVEKATPRDRELIHMDSYNCLAVVTSNTFNSDGIMFEYTQSRHQPEYFTFHDTATRKK